MSFSVTTSEENGWLNVSSLDGVTPRLLRITADPAELVPGEYMGTVTVVMPNAEPTQQVISVLFSVGPPAAPKLGVEAESFSFTYPRGTTARSESFLVLNEGGGELPFRLVLDTDTGGDWLSANADQRHYEAW